MKLFFWGIYYPLLKLLGIFSFWLPGYQDRRKFELRNRSEERAKSFKDLGLTADLAFEFSSEGEYQQVAPLITDALAIGKRIELVFFSPSVEKAILELASRHPHHIRYFRYPLVTLSPRHSFSNWITSKNLILVRYDLFPEFLAWADQSGNILKIIWVSFKKQRVKNKGIGFYKKLFFRKAQLLCYASPEDHRMGLEMGLKGSVYDFRIEQIRRRIISRDEKFMRLFPLYGSFKKQLDQFPRERRLILGNAWPSDLFLLENLPRNYLLVIVPHQLSPEILKKFHEGLEELGREAFEINDLKSTLDSSSTYIVNKKGILCELYTDFGKAYVGGGFEGSIHSVLEPLVAGSDQLSSGPKHHRSTEFDVAHSMGKITEVSTSEDFLNWLKLGNSHQGSEGLSTIFNRYPEARKEIISC